MRLSQDFFASEMLRDLVAQWHFSITLWDVILRIWRYVDSWMCYPVAHRPPKTYFPGAHGESLVWPVELVFTGRGHGGLMAADGWDVVNHRPKPNKWKGLQHITHPFVQLQLVPSSREANRGLKVLTTVFPWPILPENYGAFFELNQKRSLSKAVDDWMTRICRKMVFWGRDIYCNWI